MSTAKRRNHNCRPALVAYALAAVLAGGGTPRASGQCSPGGLNDGPLSVTKGSVNFRVEYDNAACGAGGDTIPTVRAQDCRDTLDTAYDLYVAYGFRTPYLSTLPDYPAYLYDIPDGSGEAHPDCIRIDTPSFACDTNDRGIRGTTLHELFHTIQRHYMCAVANCDGGTVGSTFGKWVSEGTARNMEDQLYLDLDLRNPGGSVQDVFNHPEYSLFDLSYNGATFWKYCAEQVGSFAAEPEFGADLLVDFWEQIESSETTSGSRALNRVIARTPRGSLRSLYIDYALCNYTHEFDVSALPNPGRYDYVDETQLETAGTPPPAYPLVARHAVAFPTAGSGDLEAYSAAYYEAPVPAGTACQAVGFRGLASRTFSSLGDSDPVLGWGLVGLTADRRAVALSRGSGTEWGSAVIVSPARPITRLTGVVIGLDRFAEYDYWFDRGPLTLLIIRPTAAEPARPGPASQGGRMLVRVIVDGPANLKPEGTGLRSVAGLHADDFTVQVGSRPATVLNAAYVGGEYWLAVSAPTQPAGDGYYDLRVGFAGCDQLVATSRDSVLYGVYRLNHMLVIDRSGSMKDPSVTRKIDAAKNAAALFVDCVSDGDRVGMVAFTGNQIACDDDADPLQPLAMADAAQRDLVIQAVEDLMPGQRTSIGDGLWKAQSQLDRFNLDTDVHLMLLLSDGEENEERYWSGHDVCAQDARSRIEPDDTSIDAIAFGPETDQELMQEIATATDGDYTYVDVRGPTLAGTSGSSMISELADAYVYSLQRARGLQRLFFAAGAAAADADVDLDIPVTEEHILEGVVFVNVDAVGASLSTRLTRPDGTVVGPALATIYATDTHVVYHLKDEMARGTWRLRLHSAKDATYIAGLLGLPYRGVELRLAVSQVWTGGVDNEHQGGRFEHGVPVTLLAVLNAPTGPVTGARVHVDVTKPDGTVSCGPHWMLDDGTQNDGDADDGVYGLIFTDTAQASTGGVDNDDPLNPPPPGMAGSYRVDVLATGKSPVGEPFRRLASTGFQVYRDPAMPDGDRMPDTWEVYYGTDPRINDASYDTDDDGLKHVTEFDLGTNPLNPDTDGDGEADGSEVHGGRCPLDPRDGLLPAPDDVEVVTDTADEDHMYLEPDANLLRFPWETSYEGMRIYRAKGAPVAFSLLATLAPGQGWGGNYFDRSAEFGKTYYYRFQALGAGGAVTRTSRVVSGTPVAMAGDFSGDGRIRLEDHATFAAGLGGPFVWPDPEGVHAEHCVWIFDFDRDRDLDLRDFAEFQRRFGR
ncbi:MAG: VWA domain-containing protein [Planctomycetes bacterium]|nr:VWA domain-containing protein [Planctomycetota bacterium]